MADDVRVSDAERQQIVDRLRQETTDGRLTLDEFDERITEAYAAKTRRELDHVLRELPVPATPEPVGAAGAVGGTPPAMADDLPPHLERRARRQWREQLQSSIGGFIAVNGACIAIWAQAGHDHFWPAWVLIPTGVGVVKTLIGGIDEQREIVMRREAKRQSQELKQKTA